jgi:predicted helicase
MVVLGNPPYSNFGMLNKNAWINDLLDDYKQGLNERKLNLDDDFIKFIRFGQWRIEKSGEGILAYITNNTFIDGLTHRRMRQSLLEVFTDIYILNLHGSSKKHEQAPDGSKDENIFDIQQGVSISLFVKKTGKAGPARVHYAELWGTRANKYKRLAQRDVESIRWKHLKPQAPHFFFVPKDFNAEAEYQQGWSLTDIFPVQQNGVKTDRDDLFIDFDRLQLEKRMKTFYSDEWLLPAFRDAYRVENSSSYDLLTRRLKTTYERKNIQRCLYRPFDVRWLYYAPGLTSRPAWEVMQHLIDGNNKALIACRQFAAHRYFTVNCTDKLTEISSQAYAPLNIFPLYLYPNGDYPATLFDHANGRRPNLADKFISEISTRLKLTFLPDGAGDLKKTFGPEDIFHYAYAVFHSPTYRARYAEFLKIDFPRLPLTSDKRLFAKLAAKGAELVGLHLLKASTLDDFITSFPVAGSNAVDKVRYEKRKVWINDEQYFGGVPEAVWEFQVGGYQVCDKWLKDRKGRALSSDDIAHYQRIVVALKDTLHLMAEIDKAIPSWPLP